MSLGRADTNGGLGRGLLRAVIFLAAIALVLVVMAPMARAAGPQPTAAPATAEPRYDAITDSSSSDLLTTASVRSGRECKTSDRPGTEPPIADSAAAWSEQTDQSARSDRVDAEFAARGPCGQTPPFDSYGLGSLLWHGPDWGVPALGHRT